MIVRYILICVFTVAIIFNDAIADSQNCQQCHQTEVANYLNSDHAKAMAEASESSVLGNFNNAEFHYHQQSARFYKDSGNYFVQITTPESKAIYQVSFTFGHYPLQQYLVKLEHGKMHVLPFAWDSRHKEQGGQRWFHIYPNEEIKSADRLHWQQPLQNWNGMCADCHSDGLKRNYDIASNSFNTVWDNINVGCQSCHGKVPEHSKTNPLANHHKISASQGAWVRESKMDTARWQGAERKNDYLDTCYGCHSLRSPLTDSFTHKKAYLDQFLPSLLAQPLYHADGQIKEEVYVYGSFLQSKMHQAGVGCIDCHEPHSMKLKIEGNGLCLQCHSAETFNEKTHHGHQTTSEGAQCVNCHMPETTYMVVDDRRDHSFKIPRPELSNEFGTPNVCKNCHTGESNQWASAAISSWHKDKSALSDNKMTLLKLSAGRQVLTSDIIQAINDNEISEIERASAIAQLPNVTEKLPANVLKTWLNSDEPLVRIASARVLNLVPVERQQALLSKATQDPLKAVRVSAVQFSNNETLANNLNFQGVLKELAEVNDISSWRAEGHLNQGRYHLTQRAPIEALSRYQQAIEIDPYHDASYIELAQLYRQFGNDDGEAQAYLQGMEAVPMSAILKYSYGLYQVRGGDKLAAVGYLKQAMDLMPTDVRYTYGYILSLDSIGESEKALKDLMVVYKKLEGDQRLTDLGLFLANKLNDKAAAKIFMSN